MAHTSSTHNGPWGFAGQYRVGEASNPGPILLEDDNSSTASLESPSAGDVSLVLPDADKVLVTMRLLPDQVREMCSCMVAMGRSLK